MFVFCVVGGCLPKADVWPLDINKDGDDDFNVVFNCDDILDSGPQLIERDIYRLWLSLGVIFIRGKNVALPLAPYVLNTDDEVFNIFNIFNDSGVDIVVLLDKLACCWYFYFLWHICLATFISSVVIHQEDRW